MATTKKPKKDMAKGVSKNNRLRLTEQEIDIVNDYRRIQTEAKGMGLRDTDVHSGWIKTDDASLYFQNPNFKKGNGEEFAKELINSLVKYAPKFKKINRTKVKDGHLLIVDPSDLHVGKLSTKFETGEDYNSQIAVSRALEGVEGLIQKANGFNIDKVCLIAGNDILHTDTPKRMTTSGTPQDTDGMWYDNFLMAKQLYIDIIDKLIQIADVHFVYNPSNHDYTNGFFLADVIRTHYRNCKNITFDCSIAHRKYFAYGKNLIGSTHGDGAKNTDLGSLMSIESKQLWGESEFRYIYTHHVHHKIAKDYINVTVESLRSPSPADSWHSRNGYINQPAVEAFVHHKTQGQIARLTHYF
jgi:hypothetical protein